MLLSRGQRMVEAALATVTKESELVSSCLTAHQHNTGYSVPLMVECWNDLY